MNLRKFLQFQVTVNFSVVLITLIGVSATGEPPLNVTMLLWVNLIGDTLGSLALATEKP